jgi:predicted  nucleic acid-binding Zn-ribbon protein
MQQTIDALSNQVNRLNDKLTQMQETDRSLIDMERLTRAEQRAESVRAQMLDTESKLADLQARMDQVDYSLRPENIDRSVAGYGTVHPEDARDSRRRQLENEKARLQAQITLLENSRTRLQSSLSTAEAEVDLLRRRIDQKQLDNSSLVEPSPTPDKP